jgi:hypothetical protein
VNRPGCLGCVAWIAVGELLCGCATESGFRPRSTQEPAAHATVVERCTENDLRPTREGFLQEVLFPEATSRTPRFNDHTRGSYHVKKLDVARGLRELAQRCSLDLRAVLVVGPVGDLWTYYVFAFLAEASSLRVNSVVMPHARITRKGTQLLPVEDAAGVLDRLTQELVRQGSATSTPTAGSEDADHDVALVRYDANGAPLWYGNSAARGPVEGRDAFVDTIERLLSGSRTTYGHGAREPQRQ